nr:MAG TPA: Ribonuclease H2 subunit A [Caudoviricetes sp.]
MILRATVRGRPLLGTLPSGFFGCFVCSIVLLFVFLQCNEPQEGRAGA